MAAELNRVVEHVRSVLVKQGTDAMTDGDLVKRYREQRDDVAFEALVRRHGPMVMGVCRRVLRNLHDAEDAFQANFQVFGNGRVAGSPDVVLGNPNTTNIAFWFGRTRLSDIRDGTSNTI